MSFFKKKTKPQRRPPVLTPEETEEFNKYVYPFENFAMEGGGSKGTAYVGAIRVSTACIVHGDIADYLNGRTDISVLILFYSLLCSILF